MRTNYIIEFPASHSIPVPLRLLIVAFLGERIKCESMFPRMPVSVHYAGRLLRFIWRVTTVKQWSYGRRASTPHF